jgi:hypothetical protein
VVRSSGRVESLAEIGDIVVASRRDTPIHIRDVDEVSIGRDLRTGTASMNGRETVLGTVLMLVGGNSRTVAARPLPRDRRRHFRLRRWPRLVPGPHRADAFIVRAGLPSLHTGFDRHRADRSQRRAEVAKRNATRRIIYAFNLIPRDGL